MGRRHYRPKKVSKFELFQIMLTAVIFTIVFLVVFTWRFVTNCIFAWPIRWDIHTCWNEQIAPANEQAAEKAINFLP